MGSQTTTYKLPYPTGGDRVMDGDDAIKALAQRVETVCQFYYAEIILASGTTYNTKDVTFPVAFDAAPSVIVQVGTKNAPIAGYYAIAYSVTTTGCRLRVDKVVGGAPSSNTTVGVALMVGETRSVL